MIQILSGTHAGRTLELSKSLTTGQAGHPGRGDHSPSSRLFHYPRRRHRVSRGQRALLDAQAHRLNDHDIIEIAGVKMEFFSQTVQN
jgi:hypothetical protein